jgi:RNAse (barnase) inhibitor barstar
MNKKTIVIHGDKISDLETFYVEVDKAITKNLDWKTGHNLDSFHSLLRGGNGVYEYEEPIRLVWTNFSHSSKALGKPTAKKLTTIIKEHNHIEFATTDKSEPPLPTSIDWWEKRRGKYNAGLIIAGLLAFFSYAILGSFLLPPKHDFEITLFTTIFQGFGYLIMIGVANIFYYLGNVVDTNVNKDNKDEFRQRLYNLGFWFSCGLPFIIPVVIIVMYLK